MQFEPFFLLSPPDGAQGGDPMPTFIFMGAIFLIMYFFMIRPQTKKAKQQKEFLAQLQKGDKVVTVGGVHGKIVKAEDNHLVIEVDTNVKLKVERSAVSLEYTKAAAGTNGNSTEAKKE